MTDLEKEYKQKSYKSTKGSDISCGMYLLNRHRDLACQHSDMTTLDEGILHSLSCTFQIDIEI